MEILLIIAGWFLALFVIAVFRTKQSRRNLANAIRRTPEVNGIAFMLNMILFIGCIVLSVKNDLSALQALGLGAGSVVINGIVTTFYLWRNR